MAIKCVSIMLVKCLTKFDKNLRKNAHVRQWTTPVDITHHPPQELLIASRWAYKNARQSQKLTIITQITKYSLYRTHMLFIHVH